MTVTILYRLFTTVQGIGFRLWGAILDFRWRSFMAIAPTPKHPPTAHRGEYG